MTHAVQDASATEAKAKTVVLSVDAMGGDKGPATVVAGLARFLADTPGAKAILHGPEAELRPLVAKRRIEGRVTIRDARDVVKMTDKPSQVLRSGKDSSMWSTIDAVKQGEADVAVSCGVKRPAIACLWPSRNPAGFNVMLDVGADIRAEKEDLLAFAMMGASYARNGLGLPVPRVGLLNVGTEEHKGRAELKEAQDLIIRAAPAGAFDYVGFVEGGDLPSDRVDVIVTDGFTGNIALKTGEGTATLISSLLKEAFNKSILSRFAALLAMTSLMRLSHRIDPRRVNGGVFLGLNKTVIKSHGSADATGVAAALQLAYKLGASGFSERVAARIASAAMLAHDSQTEDADKRARAKEDDPQ
jgi:phosphate acyltransferase